MHTPDEGACLTKPEWQEWYALHGAGKVTGQLTRCQAGYERTLEGKAGGENGMRLAKFHMKNSSLVEGQRLEM